MAVDQVEVGRVYAMEDGRKLRIIREWTAENGYTRVGFEVIEGPPGGFLDCSLAEFRAKALREVAARSGAA